MSPRPGAVRRRRPAAAVQPGLPMALPPPATPPGRLALEASTPCSAPFDSDDWLFSVDWEGSRCLLLSDGEGRVRLQGETAALDERFPEIVRRAAFDDGRRAVFEGTICVLDAEGRPDLEALFRRVESGAPGPPAVYLATDLLALDGVPLTELPLLARLAALAELVLPASAVQVPDQVIGHGVALATAATDRGLDAVVARRQGAPYRAGLASPDRLRIALSRRRHAVVVGWCRRSARWRVVLGDWADGRLRLVGSAEVGSAASRRWLTATAQLAHEAVIEDAGVAGERVTWVRPLLVATVEPAGEHIDDAGLRAWRLVALRDDVDPRWCLRRAAVDPPHRAANLARRAFSPTVLSPLPLDGAA